MRAFRSAPGTSRRSRTVEHRNRARDAPTSLAAGECGRCTELAGFYAERRLAQRMWVDATTSPLLWPSSAVGGRERIIEWAVKLIETRQQRRCRRTERASRKMRQHGTDAHQARESRTDVAVVVKHRADDPVKLWRMPSLVEPSGDDLDTAVVLVKLRPDRRRVEFRSQGARLASTRGTPG